MKREFNIANAPEFLQLAADIAAQVIHSRARMDEVASIELGQAVAERLAEAFAGSRVRIPAGTWNGRALFCFDLSRRDLDLYRAFTGHNHRELAARFDVSLRTVYRIIKRVRAILRGPAPASTPTIHPSASRNLLFPSPPQKHPRKVA